MAARRRPARKYRHRHLAQCRAIGAGYGIVQAGVAQTPEMIEQYTFDFSFGKDWQSLPHKLLDRTVSSNHLSSVG